jgi:transposase
MPAPTVFVAKLRDKERLRLQQAARSSADPRLRERCRAVLWSEEGKTTGEIGRLLGVAATTPMRWIKDYRRFGFRGLVPDKSPGRPRMVDADGEAVLQAVIGTNPRDLGYRFTRWTLATLAEHLTSVLHATVSAFAVGSALERLRYRYKRPKLSLKHKQDPQSVRRARRELRDALKKSPPAPTATPLSFRTNASSISIPA